jgi:actin-related protein
MSITARAIQPSRAPGLPSLQRKCACGSARAAGHHRCDACEAAAPAQQQAAPLHELAPADPAHGAFTISTPDDPYEREADRAAHQVMAGTPASVTSGGEPRLQRLPAATPNLTHAPADVQTVLGTAGRPLDTGTRGFFEPRFGRDFSSVRVHADDAADRSARAVDAQAYTVGHHIVFARGSYAPAAESGRRLLAHELAHVVQQSHTPGQMPAVQRRAKGPGGCGWIDLAAGTLLGGAAHVQIQGRLASRGFVDEMPIPRATKSNGVGSRKCQPLGTSWGYADVARIGKPTVGISEIKPYFLAKSGVARLEAMHYRLRANQSKQRLTGTSTCGKQPAGFDDNAFSATVGSITTATTFDLLKGVITGEEDFGPFSMDPHRNLKAKEYSLGGIGYWCVLNEEGKKKKQEEEEKKKKEKEEKEKKKKEEKERKQKEKEEKKKQKEKEKSEKDKAKKEKAEKEKAEKEKAKMEKAEKERAEREKAEKEKAKKEKAKKEKAEKEKAEKEKAKGEGSAGAANLGFGISIFGTSVGGGNIGVGISVGSNSASVGTLGAGVSWFSDSATAGAAGASASHDSMSATALAAGASASGDSEQATVAAAGASSSEGSTAASAGVAGKSESKDDISATAGAAGKSESEGNLTAGAGGTASGQKVTGAVGASTGSSKATVDPAEATGPGVDKVPTGQSDEEVMKQDAGGGDKPGGTAAGKGGAKPGDKPGDRPEGQGESKTEGEGDKGGEQQRNAGPSGPANTQKQPGSPAGTGGQGQQGQKDKAGSTGTDKPGGDAEAGKPGGAAEAGKGGPADTGKPGGTATTAGAGSGSGTFTSSTAGGGGAADLGVLPVFPRGASNDQREKIGQEAAQVAKMLQNAQPTQKLLLQYLASKDPTGQYIVPTSVWVDKLLKATDGLKPEDLEYLKTLNWKPGSISAEELRKRVLDALKNKGKPPKGDADKPGGKTQGADPGEGKGKGGKGEGDQPGKGEAEKDKGDKPGKGEADKEEGKKKGDAEGPRIQRDRVTDPPAGSNRAEAGIFAFQILSGMTWSSTLKNGDTVECRIMVDDNGRRFELSGVSITFVSRSDTEVVVNGVKFIKTEFKVYFTKDFWSEANKFYGRGGAESLTDVDMGRHKVKR